MNQYSEELLYRSLNKYWGYDSFRTVQLSIINAVLSGTDTLAILPTGGGKSLCYQLPSIVLPGLTIVVSPLIALMEDQVKNLNAKGIQAAFINSSISRQDINNILDSIQDDNIKILYCAPERLLNESFIAALENVSIDLLVVDEAHCISQWGHDFRPSYRKIKEFIDKARIPVKMALTASATDKVVDDIIAQLSLENVAIFKESIYRENLAYQCIESDNKLIDIKNILEDSESAILYCPTRRSTEQSASWLNQHNIPSDFYHAGMSNTLRLQTQNYWIASNNVVMCATNAFGMGIDKPDVRKVLHLMAPYSLEAFYQEAGRAGRDSNEATAILLWNKQDIESLRNSTALLYPNYEFITQVYESVMNFLQISVGDGFDTLHIIDIQRLISTFKLPTIPTISAIKLIALSEYWIWNEDDSTKHKAIFTCNRADLEAMEHQDREAHKVAIGLLRIHGDIFHYTTTISPFEDGKIIGYSYEEMIKLLQRLHQWGTIDYSPARIGSSLYLQEDRVRTVDLFLNKEKIEFLKKNHQEKIDAIIRFIENDKECRSIQIAKYFNEKKPKQCGICDVCISASQLKMSVKDKDGLLKYIKAQKIVTIDTIFKEFSSFSNNDLWHILTTFADEKLIRIEQKTIYYNN